MEGTQPESEATGFVIDGVSYPVPTLDTITLDEERVLFTYADVVVQDFLPPHPDWKEHVVLAYQTRQAGKFRDPAFKRALAHIAYKRAHPEIDDVDLEAILGSLQALAVDLAVLTGGDDENPPIATSPKRQEKTTESSARERSGDSGIPTETSSETPDENPANTGTSGSDTSSPRSLAPT